MLAAFPRCLPCFLCSRRRIAEVRTSKAERNREEMAVFQGAKLHSRIYGDIQCFMDSTVNISIKEP